MSEVESCSQESIKKGRKMVAGAAKGAVGKRLNRRKTYKAKELNAKR